MNCAAFVPVFVTVSPVNVAVPRLLTENATGADAVPMVVAGKV